MKIRAWVLAVVLLAGAERAAGASHEVLYGPPPAWVKPPPAPTASATPAGAPVRIIYSDQQTRLDSGGDETYAAYRMKILTPQALSAGNIAATWNPSSDDLTVNVLKIFRGDTVIDVLATTKFQVIQRENNLDYNMLDGQLTATLQTPGLQVGDELEFAATIRRSDPVLGQRSTGFMQMPLASTLGAHRARLVWTDPKTVRWRASPDLGESPLSDTNGQHELIFELRDPKSVVIADGAPARVNMRRNIEFSGFSSWADVSNLFEPLFEQASRLAPDSPVREEAAKIAGATSDPVQRAEAALKLVQDKIRYVYVGLNGGNYRPASADETWARRFGDCKAKTVLLMTLLRELGVSSEAVLVNPEGGDGADERLPTPFAFDHVLVRATIGAKTYWLDGTRLGDEHLSTLPAPTFRWALPVRSGPVTLEAVPAEPLSLPQLIEVTTIDASAGFGVPAKVEVEEVLRGDGVFQMKSQLSGLSPEDAERAEKAYWRQQATWFEPGAVSWRYDEAQSLVVLKVTGQGRLDWDGDDQDGRSYQIPGAGFTPPNEFRRPAEQDQAAPWVTGFPRFRCWVTTIKLPATTSKWKWDYGSSPVNLRMGGVAYWRQASLQADVMRTVMSSNVYLPEITAAQAREVNSRLPSFDNKISTVFQRENTRAPVRGAAQAAGPQSTSDAPPIDWTGPAPACSAPASTTASVTR